MRYEILFLCHNKSEENIKHETNSWDQAEHFFWAMILKLKAAHDAIDTNSWQLTLTIKDDKEPPSCRYHFSKM